MKHYSPDQWGPLSEPPFCPNRHCGAHFCPPAQRRWFRRNGSYPTLLNGAVQRFRCRLCGRDFSAQSFHIDYYAKPRLDYRRLAAEVSSCVGMRAAAKLHGVDHKTVANKLMRLARGGLAAMAELWDTVSPREDLVADGFESFWVSQYSPTNVHLLVGAHSQFVYAPNAVIIRRSGRMREAQRRRRAVLERRFRADPTGVERSFTEILEVACALLATGEERAPGRALRTDEHPAYRRAVAAHGAFSALCRRGKAWHHTVSSRKPRTRANPLFAVNYLDRELRKDLVEHVRETTRFARSAHGSLDRLK